jgi:hypothetical protein
MLKFLPDVVKQRNKLRHKLLSILEVFPSRLTHKHPTHYQANSTSNNCQKTDAVNWISRTPNCSKHPYGKK